MRGLPRTAHKGPSAVEESEDPSPLGLRFLISKMRGAGLGQLILFQPDATFVPGLQSPFRAPWEGILAEDCVGMSVILPRIVHVTLVIFQEGLPTGKPQPGVSSKQPLPSQTPPVLQLTLDKVSSPNKAWTGRATVTFLSRLCDAQC